MDNFIENDEESAFKMELVTKSGKTIGSGIVIIEQSFLNAQFYNKKQRKYTDIRIALNNIIAVKEVGIISDSLILEIHYIENFKVNRLLKLQNIRLRGHSTDAISFHILMNDIIKGFPRPRRLVLFINPISGKKKGQKIYRENMAPVFKLCGIDCDVIVTSRRGQAMEAIENYDLNRIDGIVTVGGDGIFSEIVNGLMRRYQSERNVDINDVRSELIPCHLPIGMIPAGSGNVLNELLHGNKDVTTAVLRIILGDVTSTNIAGVHQEGNLSVYACLILGFGLCGRMVRDCEKARWMGPSRYSIAPLKALLTRKTINVEVEPVFKETEQLFRKPIHRLLSRTRSHDQNGIRSSLKHSDQIKVERSKSLDQNGHIPLFRKFSKGRPSLKRHAVGHKIPQSEEFRRRSSLFIKPSYDFGLAHDRATSSGSRPRNSISPENGYGNIKRTFSKKVNFADTSTAEDSDDILRDRVYSVDTWIPTFTDIDGQCVPVFGDTKLTAYSVRPCSFSDHLKHLLKVTSRVAYCFKFDFVHSLRGRGYRVRIFPDEEARQRNKYYINYDGDALLLTSTEFEVRLHRNIVKLFGTIEAKEPPD